jgi:hypothetical protein
MPEVLVATPLNWSGVSRPYSFTDGICIRELSPIRWDVARVKSEISESALDELAETRYWLCASKDYDHTSGSAGDELLELAHDAAMALQIICPTGSEHVFLKFQQTASGWDNIATSPPNNPLRRTLLGRITDLEQQGLTEHFDAVYSGIRQANARHLVRLQNPVLLLEHGQQTGNVYLSTLMFTMGLDMLFMAGEIRPFIQRVGGFLGVDSFIFPPEALMQRQPNPTVRQVLRDLYELRNTIAYGQEIPKHPYREKYSLMSTGGHQINQVSFSYVNLMHEASLFMLTTALRRVFTEGLFAVVANQQLWRRKLTVYERRYKEAGGPEPVKSRGR